MSDPKTCFVIAPIGEPQSNTRDRSDKVLAHVIGPAVTECGYQAVRADKISEPGLITSQVLQRVIDDDIVIADLTEHNPNVFYELAIRHATEKPYIQIMEEGEQLPFDVATMRVIFFDHRDLNSVAEAKKSIISQIRNTKSTPVQTPVTMSLALKALRQSDNPKDRSLADLVSATADIRNDIGKLDEKLDQLEESEDGIRYSRQKPRFFPGPRFDPDAAEELGSSVGPAAQLIFIAGFCQGTLPLVYELTMDASRSLRNTRNTAATQRRLQELHQVVRYYLRSNWGHEFVSRFRDIYRLLSYLEHVIVQHLNGS